VREVGDDVYGEDPTVGGLEELAAGSLGMKRVFVRRYPGKSVALLPTVRGDGRIVAGMPYLHYEGGGLAFWDGVCPCRGRYGGGPSLEE
jgi:hypothetical protein